VTRRILLIDFEQRSLQATTALLSKAGHEVTAVRTGREAETALREAVFDLVILEPMIPGHDGFKLIAAIKSGRLGIRPRVIAASRIFRGPRYRSLGREAGADAYLERPQPDDMILPAIAKLRPASAPAARAHETGSVTGAVPAASPARTTAATAARGSIVTGDRPAATTSAAATSGPVHVPDIAEPVAASAAVSALRVPDPLARPGVAP
jgi:DNA-binding response OmpR family regulator